MAWPDAIKFTDDPSAYGTEAYFGEDAAIRLGSQLFVSGAEMPSYEASLWVLVAPDAQSAPLRENSAFRQRAR